MKLSATEFKIVSHIIEDSVSKYYPAKPNNKRDYFHYLTMIGFINYLKLLY